mgnify:CR=1 FL=1
MIRKILHRDIRKQKKDCGYMLDCQICPHLHLAIKVWGEACFLSDESRREIKQRLIMVNRKISKQLQEK